MDVHRLPILRVISTLLKLLLRYSVIRSFITFSRITVQAKSYKKSPFVTTVITMKLFKTFCPKQTKYSSIYYFRSCGNFL